LAAKRSILALQRARHSARPSCRRWRAQRFAELPRSPLSSAILFLIAWLMKVGVYWQDRYHCSPPSRSLTTLTRFPLSRTLRPQWAISLLAPRKLMLFRGVATRCRAKRYSDAVRYIFDSNQTVASSELWHKRWISYSAAAARIPAIKTVNATANH